MASLESLWQKGKKFLGVSHGRAERRPCQPGQTS